jgi:hypothetical protein
MSMDVHGIPVDVDGKPKGWTATKREDMTEEYLQRLKLDAVDTIIDTLPADVYKYWLHRLFWGFYTSSEGQGLEPEAHRAIFSTVSELSYFLDKLKVIELPIE